MQVQSYLASNISADFFSITQNVPNNGAVKHVPTRVDILDNLIWIDKISTF